MNLNEELWKDITTHKGQYQISNLGRIKRLQTTVSMSNQFSSWNKILPEKVLKPSLDSKGYEHIILKFPKRTARIHRLVAESFLKEPSETLVKECLKSGSDVVLINHKDGNKTNNEVMNLEWCTHTYNSYKSNVNISTRPRGNTSYQSILTEDDILNIVNEVKLMTQQQVANKYNVKQITISNIITGRSWNHITGFPVKERSIKSKSKSLKLSEQQFVH